MKCNKCGNNLKLWQKYCSNCGNAIEYKHTNKLIIIAIIIIIIIILSSCITNIYIKNKKERLFNQIKEKYQISRETIANYYFRPNGRNRPEGRKLSV